MPIIIDNFFVNNPSPIDNRCVVGGTTSFYSNKDLIQYKYPGLRIWDLNVGVPFVWTGATWSSENSVGVTTDNTSSTNYIPKFKGTTLLGNSIIYETGTGAGNIGIGLAPLSILPNIPGVINPVKGLHVSGNIKTDNKFIGIGSYITDLNASNINSGTLTINRISPLYSNGGSTTIGQSYVLQNLGNTIEWVLASSIAGGSSTNSNNIAITDDNSTNSTHFINFTQNFTGYNILKTSSNKLKYNPSTGTVLSNNVDLSGYIKAKDYLSIGSNNLSSVLGSQVSLIQLSTNTGNNDYLNISNTRVSNLNSTDWRSAGHRIQQKVDNTYMAYIQFNGNNDGGISFGTGLSTVGATSIVERFKIDESGNFYMSGLVGVSTLVNTTTLVRDNTNGILKGFDLSSALGSKVNTTGTINRYQKVTGTNIIGDGYLSDNGIDTVNISKSLNISDNLVISSLIGSTTRNIAIDSNGKIITADLSDAGHSFTTNGYQKLSSGLIFQWAYLTAGSITYNFPIAFTSMCFSIHITTKRSDSGSLGMNHANNVTTTTYFARIDGTYGWMFAVGI
jgi:hypothetical protein